MSESGTFTAFEDDLIVVLGKRYEDYPDHPAWFTFQCKVCGFEGGHGQGQDEAMMIEEVTWMGLWHVEREMRGDNEGVMLSIQIESEEIRKRNGTLSTESD